MTKNLLKLVNYKKGDLASVNFNGIDEKQIFLLDLFKYMK